MRWKYMLWWFLGHMNANKQAGPLSFSGLDFGPRPKMMSKQLSGYQRSYRAFIESSACDKSIQGTYEVGQKKRKGHMRRSDKIVILGPHLVLAIKNNINRNGNEETQMWPPIRTVYWCGRRRWKLKSNLYFTPSVSPKAMFFISLMMISRDSGVSRSHQNNSPPLIPAVEKVPYSYAPSFLYFFCIFFWCFCRFPLDFLSYFICNCKYFSFLWNQTLGFSPSPFPSSAEARKHIQCMLSR